MAYSNRLGLKEHVGKLGVFISDIDDVEKVYYGKLIAVTKNGNCESDEGSYYDYFVPKTIESKITDKEIKAKAKEMTSFPVVSYPNEITEILTKAQYIAGAKWMQDCLLKS